MTPRLKRLYNEYKEVSEVFADHPYIVIKSAAGDPPERYQVEYRIKGLEQKGNSIVERTNHLVEIGLTLEYPGMEPICRMLTPIFHPNISPTVICITDHWASSESLADIIVRIGRMICYQNYNIKSPRNGEAAKWAIENIDRFPIDTVDLVLKRWPEEISVTDGVQTVNDKNRSTYKELSGPKNNEGLSQETAGYCQKCGYEMEEHNANYCIMCGTRLE